ncbi:MAG TPA: hypothetical protein VGP43_01000 [Chitinophagaceae bacterium]|nr:hypothetical protein [Chitinophagaceae bacterium]
MIEIWYIPLLGFLGLLSTFITTKGNLYDKRFRWYKRITRRGWVVALLALLIVVLTIFQYVTTKRINDKKEIEQSSQRRISDSIISAEIRKGVDYNRLRLFSDLSEALGKQNLRLDTVTKNLEILKDSAKTIIIKTPRDLPIIIMQDGGLKLFKKTDSSINLDVTIISTQAASKILSLNYFLEIHFSDGSILSSERIRPLIGKVILPKDQPIGQTIHLSTSKEISIVNIALVGIYTATDNTQQIILKEIYRYRVSEGQVGFFTSEEREQFFKKYIIK